MSRNSRRVLSVSALVAPLLLLSCGGGDGNGGTDPDPTDAIASVTVTPNAVTLDIGETQQLQATVRNGRNETVSAAVTWSTSDDTRASVSTGGLVMGVGEGSVTITASAGGKSGNAAITVNDPSPPQSPSGLQVTPLSNTEMRLDWTDNATNEDEYRVEREQVGGPLASSGPQAVYTTVATLGPNTTTYTDTGLDPAASYRYRVRACNENGCSDFSSEAEGTSFETLVIETTGLPDGAKDVAYSQTLMASGGDGAPTWDLAAGSLPTGLTLNAAGEITGTPTVAGAFDFTVRATGAGQTPTRALSITITEEVQAPEVTTTQLPDGGVGAPYEAQLQASNGDGSYEWAVTGGMLPDGVMLSSSGALSGVPTADGTFTVTFEVMSAGMTDEAELDITIHPELSVTTDALPDGVVDQAYAAQLVAGGGDGTTTWSLEAGDLPPGLSLAADGTISGSPVAAGTSTFTVGVESGVGQMVTRELSITINDPLEITTSSLPDGQVGVAYSATLAATGGDGTNTWSITGGDLPGGLGLNPTTGEISGTPTEAGSFTMTVQVQSGDGQADAANLTLDIDPAPVQITTTSLPGGTVGVAYNQQLQATGGDGVNYTWSLAGGSLPPGLNLGADGVISGTPTADGVFNFTVEVNSAGQTDDQALSITIATGSVDPVVIETLFLPVAYVGTAYSGTVDASGGDGVGFTFSVSAGALPDGLSIDGSTGAITGTPTTPGTGHFEIEVASGGNTATRVYMLTASGAPASAFNLHLHNISGVLPSASLQNALDQALAKWEEIVTGNITNLLINGLPDSFCEGFGGEFNGRTIDDIEILVNITPIDGVGGTLAQAGPCAVTTRTPSNQAQPILGVTTFDSDDLDSFSTERARDIMFHEIGHVVGIGTLWNAGTNDFLVGAGEEDPRYTGPSGVAQYMVLGGPDPDIPVENTGGSGTRDSHWREVTFGDEIMTGFISAPGQPNPISIMTIGSVEDLGYTVNLGAAEAYALPSPPPPGAPPHDERPAIDDIWPGPVAWIQPDGTVITVYLRPPEGGG